MKHFAKSLVSLVIALTILATMCVVGFSASAKVNEFVLVSATATKDKTDLTATKDDSGVLETVDVVDTSTLGASAGAPATAYKFTIAKQMDGVYFKAPSNDASASSSFSVAAVRIVPTAADAQKSWDDREFLVGALGSNEAGVDVGNWEAAEYEGGYGAFTNSSDVVKFRKKLPESHDLSGKLVVAWLYTSSTNINAASELELCTVSNDNREFTFNLKALDLKVGWNKVILDVNHKNGSGNPAGTAGYSGSTGGEPDASNINFIRVYEHDIADFKVGAMYVVNYGAASNGTFYDTAEEAFDNAKADDTVTLYGDATVESVMLNKGIDLELNGNTLTADYFVSFKGSEVADSSEDKSGRLDVASENLVLNAENAQLPVFAEDGKGYAFFDFNMQQVAPVADENSVTLTFRPSINTADTDFNAAWFGDGAADNGLKLGVRLTYTSQYAYEGGTATGTVSDTFVFDDAHVASVYTNNNALKITITGIADVSDLTIASVVVSELGFECVAEPVSVAAVQ